MKYLEEHRRVSIQEGAKVIMRVLGESERKTGRGHEDEDGCRQSFSVDGMGVEILNCR